MRSPLDQEFISLLTNSSDDILRAVNTLKPLGSSYSILTVGHKMYIRSIPKELNTDQSAVLEAAQLLGYISVWSILSAMNGSIGVQGLCSRWRMEMQNEIGRTPWNQHATTFGKALCQTS